MKTTRRTLPAARAAGAAAACRAALGLPASALAEDSVLKGKNLAYIAFGLQYEYQVDAGRSRQASWPPTRASTSPSMTARAIPRPQTTQLLDVVAASSRISSCSTRSMRSCCRAACARQTRPSIPLFMLENLPPEGEWVAYNTFDDVAGGGAGGRCRRQADGRQGPRARSARCDRLRPVGKALSRASTTRWPPKYPDIKIETLKAEWTADNAQTLTVDAFTRDPNVAGHLGA